MTHAGFWIDGAVRKPEARHGGNCQAVHICWKDGSDIGTCRAYSQSVRWENLYWLDTTPRESLTPEELFSVLKVAWPHLQCIKKEDDDCWVLGHGYSTHTPIDWGNLTQYPLPVEPQWIRITRENVGQYLFRDCRFRDTLQDDWKFGQVVGWCVEDEACFVDLGEQYKSSRVLKWNIVEVQNAPSA